MLTKEELLQKGISEEVADEIIAAAAADSDPVNSLQTLEKALNEDAEEGELFKANGGEGKGKKDDDDDEDDEDEGGGYNEEYMKKYMKRFMKENKGAASKAAKEVGIFAGEMKKAVSDMDLDAVDGAMIEMKDLAPILENQLDFNSKMAKAMEDISSAVEIIRAQQDQSFDLMKKAAAVQIETAKGFGEFLSTPQGRKGVTANVEMAKAAKLSPDDAKKVYTVLMKAVHNGDQIAGGIISRYESAGKDIRALTPDQKKYINDLILKEAK